MANDPTGREAHAREISRHALESIESVLAEAGTYAEIPDRNFFLMLVTGTVMKAMHHLSRQAVGPEKASAWLKMELEALGPMLSEAGSTTITIQVTVR